MEPTFDTSSPDLYPGGNPGADLIGQQVTFQLRWSDQANPWNVARHYDQLTGIAKVAYDGYVVVSVPGWQFAHRVRVTHITKENQ